MAAPAGLTVKVTSAPGTPAPVLSAILRTKGAGKLVPTVELWLLPLTIVMLAGFTVSGVSSRTWSLKESVTYTIAARVHRDAKGIQRRCRCRSAIACAWGQFTIAGDGCNQAARCHSPHHRVAFVGDVHISGVVQCNTGRERETSLGCRAPIARIARHACSGHRRNHIVRRDLPDAIVELVYHQQVSRAIQRQIKWIHAGVFRRSVIAGELHFAISRDGVDVPGGVDLAHPMIAAVGDVDIPRRVHRDPLWRV